MRYDYKCTKCGDIIEVWHSIKDDPEITCEKCGGKMVKYVSSMPNFILKGAGWPDKMRRRGDPKYDPPGGYDWI